MIHPLIEDVTAMKDAEIEAKIQDLNKKYWMAHNPSIQHQIELIINIYQEEMSNRQAAMWAKVAKEQNQDLDGLVKVR